MTKGHNIVGAEARPPDFECIFSSISRCRRIAQSRKSRAKGARIRWK